MFWCLFSQMFARHFPLAWLCLAAFCYGQHLLASFLLAFFVIGCRFLSIPRRPLTLTSPGFGIMSTHLGGESTCEDPPTGC